MVSTLTGHHKDTFETIFRHPTSHNIEWRGLVSMFKELCDVEEETNGKLKVTRNGHTLVLHVHGKDAMIDQIMQIRHFLDNSAHGTTEGARIENSVIVVLDHSGARIYRSDGSDLKPTHIKPEDPSGHDQHVHNPQGDSGGKQGPYRKMFYERIVAELQTATRVLMIGDGKGASNEVEHFFEELKANHHQKLSERIVRTEIIDLSHTTEGELAAKAKEFFAPEVVGKA